MAERDKKTSPKQAVTRVKFAPLDPPNDAKGKPRVQSPVVEVASGTYYRKFVAAEQPFEVTGTSHEEDGRTVIDITPDEELRILLADGNFVVDEPDNKESGTGSQVRTLKSEGKIGGSPVPSE